MFPMLERCDHLLADREAFRELQEQSLPQHLAEQAERQLLEPLEVLEVLVI
jgi:hypothetical protein